jgi:hypothetical protein
MDDKISADEYEVLISEGDTYIEVEGTLDALENVSFRSLAYDSNRWIHAKALLLEGSWGSAILSGSPNMTGSALLSTASNGNLESAVLTISTSNSDSRLSSSLWSQEAFDVDVGECIDPSEVETESYSLSEMGSETRVSDYEVKLEDAQAKVRSDEEAEITFSATGVEVDEEVRVAASSGNSEFFRWRPNEQGGDTGDAVSVTVGLPKTFVHQPVRLEVNGKKSNYRQITTEPVEYAREQSDILRSGGKKGVRPLIDQALFENYSVASSAISRSVKKLEDMEQTQEEEKRRKKN